MVTEILATHDWVLAVLGFATFFAVLYACDVFEWRESLRRLPFVLLGVAALIAIIVFRQSDIGLWAAARADASTLAYARFARDQPASAYLEEARRIVRQRQAERLVAPSTDVGQAILEIVAAQDTLPGRVAVYVLGTRQYHGGQFKGKTAHYDTAMDRFENQIVELVQDFVAGVGGEAFRAHEADETEQVAFAVKYVASRGTEYVQDGRYKFQSISLAAEWKVFVRGSDKWIHQGDVPSQYAPKRPMWKGSKYPEQVIGDDVAQHALAVIAEALGVEAPDLGAW